MDGPFVDEFCNCDQCLSKKASYLISGVLGSVGGPSAYYSGAKLGATTSIPGTADLIVISITWAAIVPVLYWIAGRVNKKYIG